jgi:hypothetical protein
MPAIVGALLATLLQLAVGAHFAALISEWRAEVTRGFLALTALTALVCAGLAFGLAGLGRLEGPERASLGLLTVLLLAYLVLLAGQARRARLLVGAAALLVGSAALLQAALGRPSPVLGPGPTAVAYLLSALALGAATGGLLLGHWYLMTPWLTSRPLRRLCDLLLLSLLPLTALAAWYLLLDGASAAGGLSGTVLWLGAAMITLFPFGVTVAARVCCVDGPGRGRSLQAATGLLYLAAAAVLAGGLAGNAVLLGA